MIGKYYFGLLMIEKTVGNLISSLIGWLSAGTSNTWPARGSIAAPQQLSKIVNCMKIRKKSVFQLFVHNLAGFLFLSVFSSIVSLCS